MREGVLRAIDVYVWLVNYLFTCNVLQIATRAKRTLPKMEENEQLKKKQANDNSNRV